MIVINNLDRINTEYLLEFFKVFGIYVGYIATLAVVLIIVRFTTKVPDYIFRKLLHIVAFTSIIPLAYSTNVWWIADAVEIFFLILVIVALFFLEKFSFYKKLFVEKAKHEVIVSFITLFSLMALMLAVFWGGLGAEHEYIAIAAIMAWGPGDAVAAIVGKKLGKLKLQGKMIEGVKSVEGSIGMAITSFICVWPILLLMSHHPWYISLAFSFAIAPIASLTELFTKKGWDTITVPIASALVLCLSLIWG